MSVCERCGKPTDRTPVRIEYPDGPGHGAVVCAPCEARLREQLARNGLRIVPAPRSGHVHSPGVAGPGRRELVEGQRRPAISEVELRVLDGNR